MIKFFKVFLELSLFLTSKLLSKIVIKILQQSIVKD